MRIICGLRNRGHWEKKLAMNGRYLSAQHITGHYTARETKSGGGEKRRLIQSRMLCASGGKLAIQFLNAWALIHAKITQIEPL